MAPPGAETQTILVVEDEEVVREVTRRLLQWQGYEVLVAANADEALRQFERSASVDVLLTDVVMAGGSGPELARRLTGQRPDLKVIYISGYTDEVIAQHGVLDPEVVFLHKPFTSEALARKIREVFRRDH